MRVDDVLEGRSVEREPLLLGPVRAVRRVDRVADDVVGAEGLGQTRGRCFVFVRLEDPDRLRRA